MFGPSLLTEYYRLRDNQVIEIVCPLMCVASHRVLVSSHLSQDLSLSSPHRTSLHCRRSPSTLVTSPILTMSLTRSTSLSQSTSLTQSTSRTQSTSFTQFTLLTQSTSLMQSASLMQSKLLTQSILLCTTIYTAD